MRKENTDQEHAKFNLLDNCFNVIRGLFAIAIPLTIINIMFASYYAWIYGNQVRSSSISFLLRRII